MTKNPFILVPLPLLDKLIIEADTFYGMFYAGIYYTSQKISVKLIDAYKDFIYYAQNDFFNQIPVEFHLDIEYKFGDLHFLISKRKEYTLEKNIELLNLFSRKRSTFNQSIIEWQQIRVALNMLGLNMFNAPLLIKDYQSYLSNYEIHNCPFILINAQVMYNICCSCGNIKSEERAMWAMYFGIVSIIGNKTFAQTTSEMIKCRMFGAKNKEELKQVLTNKTIKKAYNTYTTKHLYNKLLNKIQDKKMLIELGLNRRTYVSTKLKTVNDLADEIAAKELEIKEKEIRDKAKNVARQRYFKARYNRDSEPYEPDE